ncbi:MAG: hypothetical protein AAFU57_13495 [Bacteroidota bacterium]
MAKKAAETASFMMRFTQKIYEEHGESKVQWRGNVSHVQGGEDLNFSDFKDAVSFIQEHLTDLTREATNDRSSEEQENILMKSFSLFKTVAATGPKILKETLKDPRKQVANLQDQLSEYGEELLEKVPLDQWRNASKSDFLSIQESLAELSQSVALLTEKVDALNASSTTKTATKAKTPRSKSK